MWLRTMSCLQNEPVTIKRQKLNMACKKSIRRGNAEGTRANRRIHHNAYMRFCEEYGLVPFPADFWQICQFAQFLSWENKVPDTIENYVSSIRVLHRLGGYHCLEASQIHYRLMIDGFKRNNKRPRKQAEPVDHEVLFQIFEQVDLTEELEAVAWTAVLVGFNLVLRVSNLGPTTRAKFSPDHNLVREDFGQKESINMLSIRWSKTNQFRNKIKEFPLIAARDRRVCPVWWLNKMTKIIPAAPHEPLFLVRDKAE